MASKKSKKGFKHRWSSKKSARYFETRIVKIGGGEPEDVDSGAQVAFCSNEVRSSKYTFLSFWFLNLFEQFRRVANFYFLIIAIIQVSLPSPPVSPFTSVFPLVFVVLVTMLKQGYEDFCRHRSDRVINSAVVHLVRDGAVVEASSQQIKVGDIVMVSENQTFPADLVLLATSSVSGACFVMTANLDGETNLKPLTATSLTRAAMDPGQLSGMNAQIECENPNPNLLAFNGRIKVEGGELASLSLENIVLRGTQLRNTEYVYGCAVYTGRDTKMSKNSKTTANKFSTVEKTMNKFLLFFMGLLVFEVTLSTTLKYIYGVDTQDDLLHWYLGTKLTINVGQLAEDFFSYLVIYNYIIPISLYVTLEVQKFCGSMFLVWDVELYDEETGEGAKCNSSDLNEELGQIEILFSDKTGTLTENIMLFKEASINGRKYSSQQLLPKNATFSSYCNEPNPCTEDDSFLDNSYADPQDEVYISQFLSGLCVCHTVQVGASGGRQAYVNQSFENTEPQLYVEVQYNASSPDEKAIVEACQKFGMTFAGQTEEEDVLRLHVLQTRTGCRVEKVYERLHTLEFDSTRKRMSVIVRDSAGSILLYTKGAESSIIPRCSEGPLHETNQHIDGYAAVGLRTLAVGMKELTEEELTSFRDNLFTAQQALDNREQQIMKVYEEMENEFCLLGATAVEDKLQDGVRDTLIKLGEAGISVWILTGDKKETAINISYSCGHILPHLLLLDLTGLTSGTLTGRLERICQEMDTSQNQYALVVDGAALNLILPYQENKDLLFQVGSRCSSVVCCRMSPLQKSEIVRMMKDSPGAPVTAAIGDGGNDVAMIQEAHVGLGIMGKEGRAAVRSADFAFPKFRHLQKVVLVHGHWYYYRVSLLVQYFFYKNVACFTCQLYYAFFNSFSTQTLFDSVSLTLYNICYTSLPIFVFALLEQNLDKETLLSNPVCYRRHYRNKLLTWREFVLWFLQAVWHSIVFFFGWMMYWSTPSDGLSLNVSSGEILGQASFGVAIYSSVVTLVNLRLLFQSRGWNVYLVGSILASLLFYMGFTFLCHSLKIPASLLGLFSETSGDEAMPMDSSTYWVYHHVLSSAGVWLMTVLLLVAAILPDVAVRVIRKHWVSIKHGAKKRRARLDSTLNRGNYDLSAVNANLDLNFKQPNTFNLRAVKTINNNIL